MSRFRGNGAKRSSVVRPRVAGSRRRRTAGLRGLWDRARRAWAGPTPPVVRTVVGGLAVFAAGGIIGLLLAQQLDDGSSAPAQPARTSIGSPVAEYEVPVRAYRAPTAPQPVDPQPAASPPMAEWAPSALPTSRPEQPLLPELSALPPEPPSVAPTEETGPQVASLPTGRQPWERNAVPFVSQANVPMIAIVIDDLGVDQLHTQRALELPAPLTMAFIPYGFNLREHTAHARERGHELLVHIPMEPTDPAVNPGPHALLTTLEPAELQRRIAWNLSQFEGYVGLNNHMGSRFTAWTPGMRLVLDAVQERGLLFLDSRTSPDSVGAPLARRMGVPNAGRDVFLDNVKDESAIRAQLAEVERIAAKYGHAIGIGHPYDETVDTLRDWMADLRQRGFQLVPVSTIVRRRVAGEG